MHRHTVLCSATETLALKTDNFLESEALGSKRPRIRTKQWLRVLNTCV